MDDRTSERLVPEMAGRPTLIRGNSQLFFPGMGRLSENSVVSIKNKSFSVTAEVVVPDSGAEGVIIAQGGRFGGWSVYAKNGNAKFVYNVLGIQEFTTESEAAIPAGTHQVRVEFAYDGGGLAKGGDVTLYFDGTPVGTGRVGATQPMIFSADETTDIGYESGTTVTSDYTAAAAGSPARSTGCRSTSARTITTTSSTPTNGSASPWPGSKRRPISSVVCRSQGRTMHRKPRWLVEVSVVWDWRAAVFALGQQLASPDHRHLDQPSRLPVHRASLRTDAT